MINEVGVKVFIFLFVITFVWGVLVKAMVRSNPMCLEGGKDPWWFVFLGYLILADLIGIIYIAIYLIFIYW